jgi:hypothetical protein
MIERIFTKWTIRRILYIALGGYLIFQSVSDKQWFGVLLGLFFGSMGLFSFGCATGNCSNNNCEIEPEVTNKKN